jgi:WD40 repeat protein
MKIELLEIFSTSLSRISSYVFVKNANPQSDCMYVGTECGLMYFFSFQTGQLPSHSSKALDITKEFEKQHFAEVSCLIHFCTEKSIHDSRSSSFVFSGSLDRTIKIWNTNNSTNPLVQTLFGHTSGISMIAEGKKDIFLSCSLDGSIRIWTPQKGIYCYS